MRFGYIICVFFSSNLVTSTCWSQVSCYELFKTSAQLNSQNLDTSRDYFVNSGKTELEFIKFDGQLHVMDYKRLKDVINELNAGILSKMRKPRKIKIRIYRSRLSLAQYVYSEDMMESWPISGTGLDYRITSVIDAHEYAHSIFVENMGIYSPAWAHWRTTSRIYRDQNAKIDRPYLARFEKLQSDQYLLYASLTDSSISDAQKKLIHDRLNAIRIEMRELQSRVDTESEKMMSMSLVVKPPGFNKEENPYSEIWSDLIAGLYWGDFKTYGRVFADVRRTMNPVGSVLSLQRDFFTPVPVQGWNEIVGETKYVDAHVLFNPARSYLYIHFLSRAEVIDQLPDFLPKVFGSLSKEVLECAANPRCMEMDAESLNLKLIERFKKDLKEFE